MQKLAVGMRNMGLCPADDRISYVCQPLRYIQDFQDSPAANARALKELANKTIVFMQ